jgi:hypothetical protein
MRSSISIRRLAVVTACLLVTAGAVAWYCGLLSAFVPRTPSNAIVVIMPYRYGGAWVFDDPAAGLVREPFVAGVPEMIDTLVAGIPDADKGFRLYFSASPFPDYQKKLTWVRGDSTGNWYRTDDPPMEGWLCPGLFRYYQNAPKELYVKAEAKS